MTDKKRGGATPVKAPLTGETLKEKFFSTNFILAVVLLVGGLFVGFPKGEAEKVVASLFTLIGSVGAFRVFFKTAEFSPVKWIQNSNTWNYLSTIFIALFPVLTPDVFTALRAAIEAGIGGNWQGILTALISLATILWNVFKNAKLPKTPAAVTTIFVLFFFALI
jgi:hypothetical protein